MLLFCGTNTLFAYLTRLTPAISIYASHPVLLFGTLVPVLVFSFILFTPFLFPQNVHHE